MIARIFKQKYKILAIGLIILLGFSIYFNTFHSSFQFDDGYSITENSSVRNILNPQAIWNFWPTRFITYLSVALNYHFSRLNVFSYHLFNLAVHLGAAILVWWLALLTFLTPAMKDQKIAKHARLLALFAGLIFVAHPIQIQGVTYIIQRAVSLAALFYLASLSLYVKSRLLQEQGGGLRQSRFFYCGALISAILAMFSKEMAITLPFMILLYETYFLRTDKKLNWKYLSPFLFLVLVIPITMFLAKSVDFIEMRRVAETSANISPWHYLLTQFRVIVTYIRLLFIPLNQNLDYDYAIAKSLFQLPIFASFIFLTSILTIAVKLFSKYRIISFSIFWFFLTLLPESSIIPIGDVIFEHRLYLSMVGLSFFLVSLIYYLFENKTLKSMVIFLLIIISCYAVLAYKRNLIWKNELALWNDTVSKSPLKARPYNNRGVIYAKQGNFIQAFSDYAKAIQIEPNYAEAYFNRGFAHYNQGNLSQAISNYTKAIEIKPKSAGVYFNRGFAYYNNGNLPQAFSDFTKAIEISPDYAQAYSNRGVIYINQGNLSQAISDFTRAIEISPDYVAAYNNRGSVYVKQKKIPQAISDFNRVIKISPNQIEAYFNRGLAHYNEGNFTQAIFDFNKVIEMQPDFAQAYNNRGIAYYSAKEYDKAWADVHKAQELGCVVNPEFLGELKKALGNGKSIYLP